MILKEFNLTFLTFFVSGFLLWYTFLRREILYKIGECFYVFEIWEANDRFSFEFGWNHNFISTIDCINGFN